jgi:hypothetical protein
VYIRHSVSYACRAVQRVPSAGWGRSGRQHVRVVVATLLPAKAHSWGALDEAWGDGEVWESAEDLRSGDVLCYCAVAPSSLAVFLLGTE